jgi:hypothetical protein
VSIPENQQNSAYELYLKYDFNSLLRVFPSDDHNRSKRRRLLPHAQYALSHSLAATNNEERLDLASKCARTLYSDGQYKKAEELEVEVMQSRKRVLGEEHPDTLTACLATGKTKTYIATALTSPIIPTWYFVETMAHTRLAK